MNKTDFIDGWTKLRGVYPRLPDLEKQIDKQDRMIADAWFDPVRKFRREVWLDAVENCILHERYAPVPVTLRNYCFIASKNLREEEAERQRALAPDAECKWCGGSGWIWIDDDENPENDKKVFNCVCANSRDPELGRKILDKALADEEWYFDKSYHSFRRKHRWVGGAVSEAAVKTAFEQGRVGELL